MLASTARYQNESLKNNNNIERKFKNKYPPTTEYNFYIDPYYSTYYSIKNKENKITFHALSPFNRPD